MTEFVKVFLFPLLVPVLVGIGASAITSAGLVGRLDERVTAVETRLLKNEERVEYLRSRTEDQERQLTRLATVAADIQEIKADLKTLMRGNSQK